MPENMEQNLVGDAVQQKDSVDAVLPDDHPVVKSMNSLREERNQFRNRAQTAEEEAQEARKLLKEIKRELSKSEARSRETENREADQNTQRKLADFDQLQAKVAQLEEDRRLSTERDRKNQIRNAGVDAFAKAGAHSPTDAFALRESDFILRDDGTVVALDGGVEREPTVYAESLKQPDRGMAYMFRSSGAMGMGATSSVPVTGQPSLGSMSMAEKFQLKDKDPAAFKRMCEQQGIDKPF